MTVTAEPEAPSPEQEYAAHLRKRAARLIRNQRHASIWRPRRIARIVRLTAAAAALEKR